MAGWRYIAERLNGDGTSSILDTTLPLSGVSFTNVLSGPNALQGKIAPEYLGLQNPDGSPIFKKWSTAIWAESGGEIRGGGILTDIDIDGPTLSLTCTGFAGYPAGMPYTDSWFGVEIEVLDVARHIWDHLQGKPGGNLGLRIDRTTMTGKKIGKELEQVEFDTQEGPVSFEAGPVKLAWWQTDDLGREIDNLAKEQTFDYRERHGWEGDTIAHYLDFGYPSIGRRRHDLRFVVGENVVVPPPRKSAGEGFANEVLVLGAGEGRTMIRGGDARVDGALRRVAVVTDKQRRSVTSANALATEQLRMRLGVDAIEEIGVQDSDNARLGSWTEGDEILVQSRDEWGAYDTWVRVLSTTYSPEAPTIASLAVARTDMISA